MKRLALLIVVMICGATLAEGQVWKRASAFYYAQDSTRINAWDTTANHKVIKGVTWLSIRHVDGSDTLLVSLGDTATTGATMKLYGGATFTFENYRLPDSIYFKGSSTDSIVAYELKGF